MQSVGSSIRVFALAIVGLLALAACTGATPAAESVEDPVEEPVAAAVREAPYVLRTAPELTMEVSSLAVSRTGRLSSYYTCEGADTSPELVWSGAPDGTQSFVVMMEDPASDEIDRATPTLWTHWILYSIPPTVTSLSEELPATETLENGAAYGTNDYGNAFYSVPCPEPTVHIQLANCGGTGSGCANSETIPAKLRPYDFYVYALDKELELAPGATRNQVLQEIEGHIIGAGKLSPEFRSYKTTGTFQHN